MPYAMNHLAAIDCSVIAYDPDGLMRPIALSSGSYDACRCFAANLLHECRLRHGSCITQKSGEVWEMNTDSFPVLLGLYSCLLAIQPDPLDTWDAP